MYIIYDYISNLNNGFLINRHRENPYQNRRIYGHSPYGTWDIGGKGAKAD